MDRIILEDVPQICQEIEKEASILKGKSLLITGGSGFICSYFLDTISFLNETFFTTPCELICVDNLITGNKRRTSHLLSKSYFKFINHDVSKPLYFDGSVDFVVHGASIASPAIYRKYPIQTIDTNAFGTRYLLQLAMDKGAQSFLYLSSSEIYGDPSPENIPTPESYWGNVSSTGPRAPYDESKRLAEALCMSFWRVYNFPVNIARPFNVYGPGLRLDDRRVIPDFINNAVHNEPIVLYSDGQATRSFCYVSDAVTGFFKILLSGLRGEVFNVGNDSEEISIAELAGIINELSGSNLPIVYRESEDADYAKDNPQRRRPELTKIRRLLNYEPKVDIRTGLKRSIEWYKLAYNL
jgi:dTDP-glucose 4,6-dehydratase/UDP-glucuronate decarboxylase